MINNPENAKNLMKSFAEKQVIQKRLIRKTVEEQNWVIEMKMQKRARRRSISTRRS